MITNPYESFMRKHLQHYGYYSGDSTKDGSLISDELQANFAELDLSGGSGDSEYDEANEKLDKDSTFLGTQDLQMREDFLRTTQIIYSYEDGRMVAHLREPRQLYGFYTSLYGPQQPARWPTGIQVLPDRVRHIHWSPKDPESLYIPTGQEASPMAVSHEGQGRAVFDYTPSVGNCYVRSCVKSNLTKCSNVVVSLESDKDATLLFESRFESGNLSKAVQVGRYQYELWLRCDLYTDRHTQWYYFRVENTRMNIVYRFTIVNFMKSDSLYSCGMRPLMYSERMVEEEGIGWIRVGSDIKYYKNNITYTNGKHEHSYYSMTWTFQFPYDRDTVYFAHCYPYTYSDLQEYLGDILNDPVKSRFCRQRLLCRSLADNSVYSITITSPCDSVEIVKQRKAIVLTARVHPGESNSSWMMKGFLDFLLGDSADAKLLRDNFLFRIIPMLNPDGVIVGNYRCSLTGCDLNRSYRTPIKDLFPCIWHTRAMMKRLMEDREIILYCDLHGHSRKQNMFIYGCENHNNGQLTFQEQVFPYMLARNAPDLFSFNSSKFHVQKNKEGTGRVVMWTMGILNSYTLEATFCGSTLGKKKGFHFSMKDYESLGSYFCDTLLDYCDPDPTKVKNVFFELEERMRAEILKRLQQLNVSDQDISENLEDVDLGKLCMSEIESSDGGSDSSVSDGLLGDLHNSDTKLRSKKKRLKTKKERDQKKVPLSTLKERKALMTSDTMSRLCVTRNHSEKKPEVSMKPLKLTKSAHSMCGRREVISERPERLEDGNSYRVNGHYLEALTVASVKEGLCCRNKIPKEMSNLDAIEKLNGRVHSSRRVPSKTQKLIIPDDRTEEPAEMDLRPETASLTIAAAKTRLSFQTQSLKIINQKIQRKHSGRVKKGRMSPEVIAEMPRERLDPMNSGKDSLSSSGSQVENTRGYVKKENSISVNQLNERNHTSKVARKKLSQSASGISISLLHRASLDENSRVDEENENSSLPSVGVMVNMPVITVTKVGSPSSFLLDQTNPVNKTNHSVALGITDSNDDEEFSQYLETHSDVKTLCIDKHQTASKSVKPASALPRRLSLSNNRSFTAVNDSDGDRSLVISRTINPLMTKPEAASSQEMPQHSRSTTDRHMESLRRRLSESLEHETSTDRLGFNNSVNGKDFSEEVSFPEMANPQQSKRASTSPFKVLLKLDQEQTQQSSSQGRSHVMPFRRQVNSQQPCTRQMLRKKQA